MIRLIWKFKYKLLRFEKLFIGSIKDTGFNINTIIFIFYLTILMEQNDA